MTSIFRIAAVATVAAGLFAAVPASAQGLSNIATADALRAQSAGKGVPHITIPKPRTIDARTMGGLTVDVLRARAAALGRQVPNVTPRVATSQHSMNALARLRAQAAADAQAKLNGLRSIGR